MACAAGGFYTAAAHLMRPYVNLPLGEPLRKTAAPLDKESQHPRRKAPEAWGGCGACDCCRGALALAPLGGGGHVLRSAYRPEADSPGGSTVGKRRGAAIEAAAHHGQRRGGALVSTAFGDAPGEGNGWGQGGGGGAGNAARAEDGDFVVSSASASSPGATAGNGKGWVGRSSGEESPSRRSSSHRNTGGGGGGAGESCGRGAPTRSAGALDRV